MLHWGLLAAAHRLPFLPIRAGLGSDVHAGEPGAAHGPLPLRRRRGTGRHARAAAGRRADPPEPRRRRGQRPVPRARTRTSTTCSAWPPSAAYLSCERIVPTAEPAGVRAAAEPAGQPGHGGRRGRGARTARTSPPACRTTAATRRSRPGTRRRPPTRRLAAVPGRVPGRRRGRLPAGRAAVRRAPADAAGEQAAAPDEPPGCATRGEPHGERADAGPRSAWWPAPRRGAATARSWPARWA